MSIPPRNSEPPHHLRTAALDATAPPGSPDSPYAPPLSLQPPRRRHTEWLAALRAVFFTALAGGIAVTASHPRTAGLGVAAALCMAVIGFAASLLPQSQKPAATTTRSQNISSSRFPARWRSFCIILTAALITAGIVLFALTGLR